MPTTGLSIVKDALLEHNVIQLGTDPSAEDADFVLGRLNGILDAWNAKREAVYCETIAVNPLTAALSPHTIGPTGTWVVAQRPVTIESAAVYVSTTVKQPIDCDHDALWYARLSIPTMTSTFPTDLYYEKDWPNGKLFFWPIGLGAQNVELVMRVLLSALTLAGTFSLPPGYQDALTKTLAEDIATPYRRPVTDTLAKRAREARALIFEDNLVVPSLVTKDAGMPRSRPASCNYLTREIY